MPAHSTGNLNSGCGPGRWRPGQEPQLLLLADAQDLLDLGRAVAGGLEQCRGHHFERGGKRHHSPALLVQGPAGGAPATNQLSQEPISAARSGSRSKTYRRRIRVSSRSSLASSSASRAVSTTLRRRSSSCSGLQALGRGLMRPLLVLSLTRLLPGRIATANLALIESSKELPNTYATFARKYLSQAH